jgi:DNA topoisomerase-3
MVQMVLGMPERPRPDDAADALAIAIWAANTAGSAGARLSPVMDRASIDPIARGESGYQRTVREALSRERDEAVSAGTGTGGSVTPARGAGSAVTPAGGAVGAITPAGGAVGAVTPAEEGEPEEPDEPVEAAPARPAKRTAP